MSELDLSVVLPIYDEAQTLERTFAELVPALEELGERYEIVCVDDGSRDDSLACLERIAAARPNVSIERIPVNRGKGAALRVGVLAAAGRRIVFMDADLSTDLGALRPLLAALEDCAIALGSRNTPGASIRRRQPWLRESFGKAFLWLARTAFAPEIADFTCGFKGFRRAAAREVFSRTRISRWACDVEIVVIARCLGLRIAQVPVEWRHHPGSKVRVPSAVFTSLCDMARILVHRAAGRYR
jgi:dolichyl-phosphate beta-glucosyltransferase